jgi:hypothetical protein
MIPEFNIDGNLPEGIYRIDENEFIKRFQTKRNSGGNIYMISNDEQLKQAQQAIINLQSSAGSVDSRLQSGRRAGNSC